MHLLDAWLYCDLRAGGWPGGVPRARSAMVTSSPIDHGRAPSRTNEPIMPMDSPLRKHRGGSPSPFRRPLAVLGLLLCSLVVASGAEAQRPGSAAAAPSLLGEAPGAHYWV
jgi:hypothetical protein